TVSAEKIRATADLMVSTGLRDHGWMFVNIDDGWEAPKRAPNGEIQPNEKFPDMKALADYVHAKGLKLGIYSSPGPRTCGGYLGSYGHEYQDAATWAKWGIDYLKYDWCSYGRIAKDHSLPELQKPYRLMRKALDAVDRDIVYSLCQYGMGEVWKWGAQVGGNLWRTTGDITDTWESMSRIGFGQAELYPYAGPGHWNDPDMLVVGWVGWSEHLHRTRLTVNEQYTHISLWSLLSAPLLLGCDFSRLNAFTLNLLTNDEVLAVNQDPLGKQARRVLQKDDFQVWMKDLSDGSKAVGIFNLGEKRAEFALRWEKIGLARRQSVRDLWRQKDLGEFADEFRASVNRHGVVLIKVSPAE
ncbi:MAG TPA: glycoside hydrolase family 27 protein, partial [Bacteroidetes bacterium]|nr:glycoside hydrolase family 27 protein [Bacteroidota bacterium]